MGDFFSQADDILNPSNAKAGLDAFSGVTGAKAANRAADLQAQSAQDAIKFERETRDLARSDLSPFVSFATGSINDLFQPRYAETLDNFNWKEYLRQNPDVADPNKWSGHGATPAENAWAHYQKFGKNEGRAFAPINATQNPLISRDSVLGKYLDLLDPQKQADYLTNNPMFQAAINQFGTKSKNTLGFSGLKGDLANAITQNYMATGQSYVDKQRNALLNPIQVGQSSAAGQAVNSLNSGNSISDLLTGSGNARAAGLIGAANAQAQGSQNLVGAAAAIGSMFSDRRLKRSIRFMSMHGPYKTYLYQYKNSDHWYRGVMADEVKAINPQAVTTHESGYDVVNYGAL